MRSRMIAGVASATLLLMLSAAPASATSTTGCEDATGVCITEGSEVVEETVTQPGSGQTSPGQSQSSGPSGQGSSEPGYSVPSTWDDYDREAAMAEWRRRSPESFGTSLLTGSTQQPTGAPPCGVLVVPYVYTPCEGEEPPEPAPQQPRVTIFQVINMAMAKIRLPAPDMGSAPCAEADCKGTVGVPVWFWLEGNQWRTYSASASAGGLDVSVTAKPSKVVWDLGDGQSVTCTSAGTAYDTSKGWASSPDCGVPGGYTQAGDYTVTASITYDVTFGGDASGTTTLTRTSTSDVTVGEYQSVVSSHGTD